MAQVDPSHYDLAHYTHKKRWMSLWYQIREIYELAEGPVLEIGCGSGLFKTVVAALGINIETVDIASELEPDYLATVTELPFVAEAYDLVCSFQTLEHLPYEQSLRAFSEMVRVTRQYVVISLPDAQTMWRYMFDLPKLGYFQFLVPRPRLRPQVHRFDGQHYWEVNKSGYPLSKVIEDFCHQAEVELIRSYRVKENPYHRFMVFKKLYN
jgi:SAM-dependent methyltransferase